MYDRRNRSLTILDLGLAFDPQEKLQLIYKDVIAGITDLYGPNIRGGLATPASDLVRGRVMLYEVMTRAYPSRGPPYRSSSINALDPSPPLLDRRNSARS